MVVVSSLGLFPFPLQHIRISIVLDVSNTLTFSQGLEKYGFGQHIWDLDITTLIEARKVRFSPLLHHPLLPPSFPFLLLSHPPTNSLQQQANINVLFFRSSSQQKSHSSGLPA